MTKYYEAETLLEFVRQNIPNFGGRTTIECVENVIKEAPSVSFEDAIMAQGDSHVDKIL